MAYFVCEDFAYPFKIPAESETVLLDSLVSQFRYELVEDGVLVSEIYDFHHFINYGLGKYILLFPLHKIIQTLFRELLICKTIETVICNDDVIHKIYAAGPQSFLQISGFPDVVIAGQGTAGRMIMYYYD